MASTVDDEPDPGPIPAWERLIATLVVQRPALGRELVEGHGLRPDSLRNPRIRRLVEASLATPPGADLPFHRLAPADQALAARLLLRRLPELAEDAPAELLTRSLVDCMWDARRAGLEAEIDAVQRERRLARECGRAAEAEELAVRYYRLNEERQHHLDVRPSSVLASPVAK